MNTNYIYLDNIEYEGKGQLFAKVPTGLKYNCFNCKKIIITQPFGSYKYCIQCFNRWNKQHKQKMIINTNNDEFID